MDARCLRPTVGLANIAAMIIRSLRLSLPGRSPILFSFFFLGSLRLVEYYSPVPLIILQIFMSPAPIGLRLPDRTRPCRWAIARCWPPFTSSVPK